MHYWFMSIIDYRCYIIWRWCSIDNHHYKHYTAALSRGYRPDCDWKYFKILQSDQVLSVSVTNWKSRLTLVWLSTWTWTSTNGWFHLLCMYACNIMCVSCTYILAYPFKLGTWTKKKNLIFMTSSSVKQDISSNVTKMLYVWNQSVIDPTRQITSQLAKNQS